MDSDNEVDDKIQFFQRKKKNANLHKHCINSMKEKKTDQSICVNELSGVGICDELYKVKIDVDSSTVRKIETVDENSFSDNLRRFPDISHDKNIVSKLFNDGQQIVNYKEEDNSRPDESRFNTYPTEEKEEVDAKSVVAATAVITVRRDKIIDSEVKPPTTMQVVTINDLIKNNITPMPIHMPVKNHDVNPRDQISRMKNDRLTCIQIVSGSHWNIKDNLLMKSNTSILSPSNKNNSGKHSSFAALSGWTLKKQFKNVFSSPSVSSTSPTTGNLRPVLVCLSACPSVSVCRSIYRAFFVYVDTSVFSDHLNILKFGKTDSISFLTSSRLVRCSFRSYFKSEQ